MPRLGDLAVGDDVLISGTIDRAASKGGAQSVTLIVDGFSVGLVVNLPADVVATKTGRSPSYERELLAPEERKKRQLAAQRKYNQEYRQRKKGAA